LLQCPLCLQSEMAHYSEDKKRRYLRCLNCQLISVPETYHLAEAAEKAEYDKHINDPNDPGYRKFLARTLTPLLKRIPTGAKGLDYGCGPGPAISVMAKEQGFEVVNYDIYYHKVPEVLEKQYDFITMTEVIEHLASPAKVLKRLDKMLKPGGILAVMTKRVINQQAFSCWHYKNDPTHICFYSEKSFQWVGQKLNWQLEIIDKDVVFFLKE